MDISDAGKRDLWMCASMLAADKKGEFPPGGTCKACGKKQKQFSNTHRDCFWSDEPVDEQGRKHKHNHAFDTYYYECECGEKWDCHWGFFPCPVDGCGWKPDIEETLRKEAEEEAAWKKEQEGK